MTSRTQPSSGRRAARTPARAGGRPALVLLLVCATLSGCGAQVLKHRSEPVERPAAPKLTATQLKVLEAREQMAIAPNEPYWPYRLGEIYLESDSLPRAEAALRTSLHRDSSYAPALSLLSKLYYDAGRHQEAVEMLESARAQAAAGAVPPGLLAGLALHYEALGRRDIAGGLVREVPGSARGDSRSATVYVTLRGEDPAAATDLASSALHDDGRSAVNHNNYGITRLRAGDPKAARDAFLRAIDIDPRLPGPYYNLALLEHFYLFDDEAAAEWLKAYRQRAGEDPDGLFEAIAKGAGKPLAEKGREP